MQDQYIIGLDIGSGHGACLLLNINTSEITTTHQNWSHPVTIGDGGWALNLDPNMIWRAVANVIQTAMHKAGASPDQILGIATDSMRHAVIIVDQTGKVIFALPTKDARSASESTELAAERGEELYQRGGHWPLPIFAVSRLLWLKNSDPGTFHSANSLLSVSDWVAFRMTGTLAYEQSLASETLLYDIHSRNWAWDLIDELDLPRHIFPPIIQAGNLVGKLTASAAIELGLREGIPIFAGGGDTQSGLLGSGTVSPGQLGVIAGTTTPIQLVIENPLLDSQYRLWTSEHIIPDYWILESNVGQTGEALDWMAGFQYHDAREPVSMLAAAATRSIPGALGMNSTLGATLFNAREMGIPIGNITFSPILANGDPERARHFARAIIEGMAYGVQVNIEQLLEVAGIEQPPIQLAGGIARSKLFTQILSNVSNTTVTVPQTIEASALGAAICAAVGIDMYRNLASASQALVSEGDVFTPQPEFQPIYQELYNGWKELLDSLQTSNLLAGDLALGALLEQSNQLPSSTIKKSHPNILITASISPEALEVLKEIGNVEYEDYRQEMRLLSGEDLVEALHEHQILVTEIDIVDIEALQHLPDLRLVISCRGDPVNVDIEACTKLGIPVLNTPGRNADAVADLTIAFMLMLARKLPEAIQFLRQEGIEAGDFGRMGMAYEQFQGHELWEKKIGLVGLGAIGKKVAQRLLPFGAHVLAYDPYISSEEAILAGVELVSLKSLLTECNYISLHAPVTQETRGLIGTSQLDIMKPDAYLINTSRAALLDEDALYQALASNRLRGAALDVFSVEPPGSDHPLLRLPNVITTPHIGGNTYEVAAHQGMIIKDEIKRLLDGQKPKHILNPETLDNFSWTAQRKSLTTQELEALAQKPGPGVSDLHIDSRQMQESSLTMNEQPPPQPASQARKAGILSKVRNLITPKEKGNSLMTQSINYQETVLTMLRIIQKFIDLSIHDQALQNFSQKKNFTMYFVITDLKQEFYLRFLEGTVSGASTAPDGKPDLTLKMKADILDGMFTNRINATRAAMTGKIAFSGDTRRAMAMQKIQKDLTRLYSQARDEIGDPGDLTALSSEPIPATTRKSAPATSTTTIAATTPVGDERDEIIPVLNELYAHGLITSTGGNISLRTSQNPDHIWITPGQIFKGNLRADMMVRVDLDGVPLDEDALSASSERLVHCAIYRKRPDLNAIVHTHAPNATILMLAGFSFVPISTESAFIGNIPVVPFIMPGTEDLGNAVAEAIGNGVAVFMQNHGLVVGGSSLRRAADVTEIIESTSEKLIMLHLLGKEPPTLPDDIIEELSQLKDLMA